MFRVVRGDVQTTTGHNANQIRFETAMDPTAATSAAVKKTLVRQFLSDRDKWRLNYLGSMLQSRGQAFYAGKETALVTSLIDILCSS